MKRSAIVVGALAVALTAGAPGAVAAQDIGWWDWALREVVQTRNGEIVIPRRDTDRTDRRDRGDITLGDIILGREDRDRDRDRDRATQRDRRSDDRYEDRDRRDRDRGEGPPFCRNGEGHPVHGMRWCRDKGFGSYDRGVIWEDRGWEDIILDRRRDDRRRSTVGEGGLIDVLGSVILGRIVDERGLGGDRQPLQGRWLQLRDGGQVLQIRSGSIPIAELTDLNGDGRVDVSLVPRR